MIKLTCLGLVAAVMALTPAVGRAQDNTNAPAQNVTPKKHKFTPFHGKVKAVDASAQTLTVGKLVLNVTSSTKITKAGSHDPIELGDIHEGAYVTGAYKKSDGQLVATVIHVGKKPAKAKHTQPIPDSSAGTNTNAVAN